MEKEGIDPSNEENQLMMQLKLKKIFSYEEVYKLNKKTNEYQEKFD